ncbi:MAG: hypothetical protein WKF72_12310, partial [Nocardioidaceae bacterium]
KLAEEWTYRYLAAAYTWATEDAAAVHRIGMDDDVGTDVEPPRRPSPLTPSTAEVRAWAMARGLGVADRGRLRPEIRQAWWDAHEAGLNAEPGSH